jgi:hypothetical protein
MSYYDSPEALAANPPETWRVQKMAGTMRPRWSLFIDSSDQRPLQTFDTRTFAVRERDDPQSYTRRAIEQERLWYAGVTPSGWKSYAECLEARQRNEAYQARRKAEKEAAA